MQAYYILRPGEINGFNQSIACLTWGIELSGVVVI